jgi:hypothetical protein
MARCLLPILRLSGAFNPYALRFAAHAPFPAKPCRIVGTCDFFLDLGRAIEPTTHFP